MPRHDRPGNKLKENFIRNSLSQPRFFAYVLPVLAVAITVYWNQTRHLREQIALEGFSPIQYAESVLRPDHFKSDFPSALESASNSSIMWLYPALARAGAPMESVLKGAILLEILLVAFAYWALSAIPGGASR